MTMNRSRMNALLGFAAFAAAGLISTGPVFADPVPAAEAQPTEAVPAAEAVVPVAPVAAEPAAPAVTAVEAETVKPAVPELKPYRTVGQGEASYYGRELAGNRTANGERFNPNELTAAHRTLPMGSRVRVTNKSNGKSVIVRINDRGPFVKKRIVDVSLAAAHKIGMVRAGKAMVTLDLVK